MVFHRGSHVLRQQIGRGLRALRVDFEPPSLGIYSWTDDLNTSLVGSIEFGSPSTPSGLVMHWLPLIFCLALLRLAQALSSSGNRLLVIMEQFAEKENYSQFWNDLESTHNLTKFGCRSDADQAVFRSRL